MAGCTPAVDWVEEKAEQYRGERYHLLLNNCIHKSFRFKRELKRRGIEARVVLLFLGIGRARLPVIGRFLGRIPFPAFIHAYVEVDGRRVEVSRPPGEEGILGFINEEIRPTLKIKL